MTLHRHELLGCAPQPLAHYLKALAVLRILHEQSDPDARCAWRGERMELVTQLDRDALLGFFLDTWAPTPFVDPWNGASGFYPKDKAARAEGVDPIAGSAAQRFAPYREVIDDARRRTAGRMERPAGSAKTGLQSDCRNEWPADALRFFRSAVVRTGEDVTYPALFGTGGNDGHLDYCANFMKRLCEVLDPATGTGRPSARGLLASSLYGTVIDGLGHGAVGQFLPGGAGGANASDGFAGAPLLNPWDFLLMLEGAAGIPVAAVRALDADELPQAAAPFAFRALAAGYGSATRSDESARGEQWMPLWGGLASWPEVAALFREGRMALGARRARRSLEAARAVCRGGASRGVVAFQRFALIERNGQSNLAVPVGRFEVRDDPHVGLLDEVAPWVDELHRASKDAPGSLARDVRRIEDAMMDLCREGTRATRWQDLLVALAQAEDALVRRPKHTASAWLKPIPQLDPEWLRLAADDTAEVRLAAAVASQGWPGARGPAGSIRTHCLPLDPRRPERFDGTGERLADPATVVWRGRDLVADLMAVVERRLIEGARDGSDGLPLEGRLYASLADVASFLAGELDDNRLSALARGFMAIRWHGPDLIRTRDALRPRGPDDRVPPSPWAVVRLVYGARSSPENPPAVLDPQPFSRLRAGRLSAAVEAASRRLAASGLRPKATVAIGDPDTAHRYAAALAFPLSARDLGRLRRIAARIPDPDTSRNQE